MEIKKNLDGKKLAVALEGRLDTTTAPVLEEELKDVLPDLEELLFDFSKLEYISSAGLRILLSTHKVLKGNMSVSNASDEIMEVFDITGFTGILNIVK